MTVFLIRKSANLGKFPKSNDFPYKKIRQIRKVVNVAATVTRNERVIYCHNVQYLVQ
jgi:hypothetical protein